jgi:hypothetical protein
MHPLVAIGNVGIGRDQPNGVIVSKPNNRRAFAGSWQHFAVNAGVLIVRPKSLANAINKGANSAVLE